MHDDEHWSRVQAAVIELTGLFPEDIIVIGGVAVYLHALASSSGLPVETTHDVDLMVALATWSDIREGYDVVTNRRLSKHQLTLGDVEVDLYVERNHGLRVGYADLAEHAVILNGIRVTGLEHLLLLKLGAAIARFHSAHGEKDRRDLAKVLVLLCGTEPDIVLAQASDADIEMLDKTLASNAFYEITNKNAQQASRLKKKASLFVARLKELRT
jgi:predicted nucleotidyltransferase